MVVRDINMRYKIFVCLVACLPMLYQLAILIQYLGGQAKNQFFRKDYFFVEDTQAFYKLHTLHKDWQSAKKRCVMEGASLFYPEDKTEVDAVLLHWKQTQPFAWVFVGISDLLSKGDFESIDGRPITDIYNVWGPGEPNDADGAEDCVILRRDGTLNDDRCHNKYPFICKKTLASMEWNDFCDMPDNTYIYNGDLSKCYKFHITPMNWTDAYAICSAEQSYLAIINSQEEHNYLVNLTRDTPKDHIRGDFITGILHLGFHNREQDGWKSVKGVSITDLGYSHWGGGQPDGGANELCGSMFFGGGLNDVGCGVRSFFICEHDISSFNTGFDVKFGE